MRRFNLYLGMLLAMVLAWSCNDDFDTPPVVIPSAQHTPNTTIAQLTFPSKKIYRQPSEVHFGDHK